MRYLECDKMNCVEYSNCRSFITRDEKIEMLKEYQKQLELETKGVKERIQELEKDN